MRARIRMRHFSDDVRWNSGFTLRVFERVWLDCLPISIETSSHVFDKFLVLESSRYDFASDCIGKSNVAPDVETCPHVGPLHGTRTPRIDRVQTRPVPNSLQDVVEENRMCLSGIRTPEKNHIGFFNLLIGITAPAYSKNRRQTGDAWGMSSPVAAIDVVTAHDDTRELLRNEVHFVRRLRATEDTKRLAPVLFNDGLEAVCRKIQRFFPTRRTQNTTIPDEGLS